MTEENAAGTPPDEAESIGVDPDVDLSVFAQRAEAQHIGKVVAVLAVGGALGAVARHGISTIWPMAADGFPWATFLVNVSGCFALGLLMAWVLGHAGTHPLVRPFLGTGVLGGYTTFSTYAVEADGLLREGQGWLALAYVGGSLLLGIAAAWGGLAVGGGRRGRHHDTPRPLAVGGYPTSEEGAPAASSDQRSTSEEGTPPASGDQRSTSKGDRRPATDGDGAEGDGAEGDGGE